MAEYLDRRRRNRTRQPRVELLRDPCRYRCACAPLPAHRDRAQRGPRAGRVQDPRLLPALRSVAQIALILVVPARHECLQGYTVTAHRSPARSRVGSPLTSVPPPPPPTPRLSAPRRGAPIARQRIHPVDGGARRRRLASLGHGEHTEGRRRPPPRSSRRRRARPRRRSRSRRSPAPDVAGSPRPGHRPQGFAALLRPVSASPFTASEAGKPRSVTSTCGAPPVLGTETMLPSSGSAQ